MVQDGISPLSLSQKISPKTNMEISSPNSSSTQNLVKQKAKLSAKTDLHDTTGLVAPTSSDHAANFIAMISISNQVVTESFLLALCNPIHDFILVVSQLTSFIDMANELTIFKIK